MTLEKNKFAFWPSSFQTVCQHLATCSNHLLLPFPQQSSSPRRHWLVVTA